ncbi:MAG TPA: hypothetical protein VGC85_09070 [Chthoniobacterales bacterium]
MTGAASLDNERTPRTISDMLRLVLRQSLPLAALFIFVGIACGKEPLEAVERKEFPVAENVQITLRLTDGTVHIYGSNENVVRVTAFKKAYTKERLDGMKVDVAVNGQGAEITTIFPPKPQGLSIADRSGTVDYMLIVPQSCTLKEVAVENGEVIVEGVRGGGVNVRLTNGRILATNCFAPTNLALGRGGIDVAYSWWQEQPIVLNAQSENGDITVALPKNAAVRFDLATNNGWIKNQFATDEQPEGAAQTLRLAVGENPSGEMKLHCAAGNIRIGKTY